MGEPQAPAVAFFDHASLEQLGRGLEPVRSIKTRDLARDLALDGPSSDSGAPGKMQRERRQSLETPANQVSQRSGQRQGQLRAHASFRSLARIARRVA